MLSLWNAARSNDVGVALLAVGQSDKALLSFRLATQSLMGVCCESPQYDPCIDTEAVLLESFHASVEVANLKDESFYIYNHTVHFNPSFAQNSCRRADINICNAAILFNIALAHHLEATTATCERTYTKALQFYEKCFGLVDEIALDSDLARQLMIATLNNQSQIHHKLGGSHEALQKLDLVKAIAFSLELGEDFCTVVGERDVSGFILNSVRIGSPHGAACA